MSELFLLSKAQMSRLKPYFPLAHGVPRVDDRRVPLCQESCRPDRIWLN